MADLRVRGGVVAFCIAALAASAWLVLATEPGSEATAPPADARVGNVAEAPPPIPLEHMPPPFEDRMIRKPGAMEPVPSQTAAFCSEGNWSHLDVVVSQGEGGEFRVDPAAWERALTGTRAGIASWMSHCKRDGEPVRILAADDGALLATYAPSTGLRSY